jgi:hypothetical protein
MINKPKTVAIAASSIKGCEGPMIVAFFGPTGDVAGCCVRGLAGGGAGLDCFADSEGRFAVAASAARAFRVVAGAAVPATGNPAVPRPVAAASSGLA